MWWGRTLWLQHLQKGPHHQCPEWEEPVGVPICSMPTHLDPEEIAQPEEFALVLRRRPLAPPGFIHSWVDKSSSPPPEQADWLMNISLGAQLDFASLESLQVTISHYWVMCEVQCEYQSQTFALTSLTQMSLQLALPKPPDQPATWLLFTDWGALSKCNTL